MTIRQNWRCHNGHVANCCSRSMTGFPDYAGKGNLGRHLFYDVGHTIVFFGLPIQTRRET
jgi:hypothetical protein